MELIMLLMETQKPEEEASVWEENKIYIVWCQVHENIGLVYTQAAKRYRLGFCWL